MLYAVQHLAGDFLTAIIFVAVYASTGNLPLAIGFTVAAAVAQIGYAVIKGKKLDAMVWLSLFLAIAFGGAALISDDPRFVMVKPSVIHFAIAGVMLRRGWMLRYISAEHRALVPENVIIATGYAWATLMAALGATNILVALTMPFAVWAWFVSAGLLSAKLLAGIVTYFVFRTAARRRIRAGANASATG